MVKNDIPINLKDVTTNIPYKGIIYCTTNIIDGMMYLGKDKNDNPNYFGSGIYLNNAINKYGIENFYKRTVERCSSLEEMNKAEIEWIKVNNAQFSDRFYNIAPGGDGGDLSNSPNWLLRNEKISKALKISLIGHYVSPETRKKQSLKKLGGKFTQEHKDKIGESGKKPITQFDLQGNFIQNFSSIKQAREILNIEHLTVFHIDSGKLKSCAGFMFIYTQDNITNIPPYIKYIQTEENKIIRNNKAQITKKKNKDAGHKTHFSDKAKENCSIAGLLRVKNAEKFTCPHCLKENLLELHFKLHHSDNCKLKKMESNG